MTKLVSLLGALIAVIGFVQPALTVEPVHITLGIHTRQEPVGSLHERHPGAQAREELCELAPDRPAAEHEQ